jgi:hypothetical protein
MAEFKSFYIDGTAADQAWITSHRKELEDGMFEYMRDNGWIPVLDIPVKLFWEYDESTTYFKYRMEAKGKQVGKKSSKDKLGILSKEGILVANEKQAEPITA